MTNATRAVIEFPNRKPQRAGLDPARRAQMIALVRAIDFGAGDRARNQERAENKK